jgi:SnoaL-like domain
MSQENVELVARFYEPATSKAELLSAMPRTMGFCHPQVEWTSREDGLTYRGREGVREALERWLESFEEYRYEVERIIDCGGDDCSSSGLRSARGQ